MIRTENLHAETGLGDGLCRAVLAIRRRPCQQASAVGWLLAQRGRRAQPALAPMGVRVYERGAACRASLGSERRWVEEFIKPAFISVVAQRNVAREDRRRGCRGGEEPARTETGPAPGTVSLAERWHGFVDNAGEPHRLTLRHSLRWPVGPMAQGSPCAISARRTVSAAWPVTGRPSRSPGHRLARRCDRSVIVARRRSSDLSSSWKRCNISIAARQHWLWRGRVNGISLPLKNASPPDGRLKEQRLLLPVVARFFSTSPSR